MHPPAMYAIWTFAETLDPVRIKAALGALVSAYRIYWAPDDEKDAPAGSFFLGFPTAFVEANGDVASEPDEDGLVWAQICFFDDIDEGGDVTLEMGSGLVGGDALGNTLLKVGRMLAQHLDAIGPPEDPDGNPLPGFDRDDEDDEDDVSPGGKMPRYGAAPSGWVPPAESTAGEEIARHIAKYYGEPTSVLHEMLSSLIHVDVHAIPPRPERNVWTLFTTGMSDLPMSTEPGFADCRFAELILVLPPDWKIDQLKATPPPADLEEWNWPIRWLKFLARYPHEHSTWLGLGHTMPNGDPARPFASSTKLCAWLLLPPINVPAQAQQVELDDGRCVHLYVIHALYLDELNFVLSKGAKALFDAFSEADKPETLVVNRPSIMKKKRFGLF